MKRREALQSLGLASTHALFPSILSGFMASCSAPTETSATTFFFTDEEQAAVIKAIDLILPETNSKAASSTNTHMFLDEIFAKCLTNDQQQVMREGLSQLVAAMQAKEPGAELTTIDQSAFSGNEEHAWFMAFKKYTLIGFFTSKEGETVASNYVAVPGDYQGDTKLDENTLNYGNTALRF